MIPRLSSWVCASLATLLLLPVIGWALTGPEILNQALEKHEGETVRAVLNIETFQGPKKVSAHVLWVVAQFEKGSAAVFLEIAEPEDAKGMRFLLRSKRDQGAEAFMHLPATGQTVAVDADDPTTDIAGTGLTAGDMQPLMPTKNGQASIEKEEDDLLGNKCWVVRVTVPNSKEDRLLWIRKDELDVVRFQQFGPGGKLEREMKVLEFFQSERGKSYPREEEITVPGKNIRIKVRQEHGVFGIIVPEELMDPKTFGTYKWRM